MRNIWLSRAVIRCMFSSRVFLPAAGPGRFGFSLHTVKSNYPVQ